MRPLLPLALLALAGCGFDADLQVDSVCSSTPTVTLPGAVVAGATGTLPPTQIPFSLGAGIPDLTKKGVHDAEARFQSLELASTRSLQFITTLTVEVLPPSGSALPAKTVGTYQRPAGGGATPDKVVVQGDGTNLLDYLTSSGNLTLRVSGQGDSAQFPTTTWSADATTCVGVKASVDVLKAAGL